MFHDITVHGMMPHEDKSIMNHDVAWQPYSLSKPQAVNARQVGLGLVHLVHLQVPCFQRAEVIKPCWQQFPQTNSISFKLPFSIV